MLIDSHCHLGFKELGDHGPETYEILKLAKQNGVGLILDIATDIKNFNSYLNFSRNQFNNEYPIIYTALGIHPLHVKDNLNFKKSDIESHLANKKIIALGETGLDYYYSIENMEAQKDFFRQHIELAASNDLPLIIHSRQAEADTINILKESNQKFTNVIGVMHCFTGNLEFAVKALDLGFYISFSGILTFKNAEDIKEVAKFVPVDKILIETDAPYLAPPPHRGVINQPSYLKHTFDFLCNLREVKDKQSFAKQLQNNFFNLFKKAQSY
ncbi:TatD family hydrolase [Candidatus Hepatincolaceae symbiont of Richtersius coronifer]